MAINAGSVQVALGLEHKQFTQGMASASKSLNNFAGGVNQIGQKTNGFQKSLVGVGAAVAAVGYSFIKFSQQSFKVASGVAEMNVAMEAVGKSTGKGGKTIKDAAKDIRSMGIEMQASQEIAMLFVKGNIELSKASKVARVAQDLAVLSQSNSTDTARTLTYAIQTGNSMLLKSAGITKYASEAYAMYARELKVTESSLTATQRQMAITNMIIKEGAKVAGVYEAAMQEPGKVLRSFPRLLNDIQLEFGNVYLKGFGPAILAAYKLTDAFSKSIRSGGALNPVLKSMESAFAGLMKPLAEGIKQLTLLFQRIPKVSFNIQDMGKKIQNLVPVLIAGSTALSMFAGGRLLSAIPILKKFAGPLMKGGPLLAGLGILIAMSPKLRGVFFEIAGALKPLIPAFIEIGKVGLEVVSHLVTAFENIATSLQGSIVGAVQGLAVAFLGVAKVVLPLISGLAQFVEFVTRSGFIVNALAAFLISKLVLGFVLTNKAMIAFRTTMASTIAQAKVMQFQFATTFANMRANGVSTFASIKLASIGAFGAMTAGARAAGAAIATSLAPLILITIAVTAAMAIFSAWSNRNKDVEETTKKLNEAIKEQTAVLKGNETAIRGYFGDVDMVNKILLSAEGSGDKLSHSLLVLKGTTENASKVLADMQKDSKGVTKAIAEQAIGTDELAQKTITYLNNIDTKSPETMEKELRKMYVGQQKLTETQIRAALALEELQDQSENTDFSAMIKSVGDAAISTSTYGIKAVKTADNLLRLKKEQGLLATEHEQLTYYTQQLNKALADEAKKAGDVEDALDPTAPHNYAKEIAGLTAKLAEGDVTADMYAKALFGIYDADNKLNKSLHDSQKALGSMLKGLKDAKGSQIKLKDAGYELTEQMGAYQKILTENGGTAADSLEMQKKLRDQFIESAKAAKFSEEKIKELLVQLGITQSIEKLEIDIQVNITKALEALKTFRKYLFASDPDAKVVEDKLLGELNDAIAASKKSGKFGADAFKGISDAAQNASKDTATVKDAMKALEARIKSQKRAVIEAKQALQDYARSATASMYEAVRISSVYDSALSKAQRRLDLTDEYDRLINKQQTVVELMREQNNFASSIGDAVVSALSFSGVLGEQQGLVEATQSALQEQVEAENDLKIATQERQIILDEIAKIEAKIAQTTGRYAKRILGDELVKAQEALAEATTKYSEAQTIAEEKTKATNDAQSQQITFLQGLEKQAKAASGFADVISKLSEQGLSNEALKRIVDAGVDAGTTLGNELLKGGADAISKTNKFVKEVEDSGKAITKRFANTLADTLKQEMDAEAQALKRIGNETGSLIANELVLQADKSKAFADKIRTLVSMGLRGKQLEDVVGAGVEAGSKIADALILSGSSTIQESVRIHDELKNLSKNLGDELVPYFDQTGILLAQAMLSALEKKLKNIDKILAGKTGKQIKDWIDGLDDMLSDDARETADAITGTPNIKTGIVTDDPYKRIGLTQEELDRLNAIGRGDFSGVIFGNDFNHQEMARQIEEMISTINFGVPAFAKGGVVTAPTLGLVGEAGAEAVIPLSKLGSMSGSTYEISVNAGMGANGADIGAQIVEQIKRYEKQNGKRWRS